MTINNSKKHISKWIYLSISILITAFILVHSCLNASESSKWSNVFVNFFIKIFNGQGIDTAEVVNVTGIELNYDKTYIHNNIEGYGDTELVVGTTKKLSAYVLPENATNTAIKFVSSDTSIASIKQDLGNIFVTGNKKGDVVIKALSEDNHELYKEYAFHVVDAKAPISYTVSNIDIYEDSYFYLPINVDNDKLNDEEKGLYYNIGLLDIDIVDESIISKTDIDNIYQANKVGNTTVRVNNKDVIFINVLDKSTRVLPIFNSIKGSDVIYSESIANYSVIFDNEPSSKDVIYSVSNNDVASINKYGKLTVNKDNIETKIVVTATSMLDRNASISKEVIVKPITITSFELVIPYYGNHITDSYYKGETTQEIKVWLEDNTGTIGISGVTVSSSDTSIAKVYAQGSYIYIDCIAEGKTKIVVTSINNPNVSKFVDLEVVPKGVINYDNYKTFSEFVRKSIGHFLLFLVDGIFFHLFFYKLDQDLEYKNKKKWHYLIAVMFTGLFFAGLSELIQFFVPTRFGSIIDVGVDFFGFMVGAAATLLIIHLVHKHKEKKKNSSNS